MKEIREKVEDLLKSGKIDGFLGFKDGLPHLFTSPDELDNLTLTDGDKRYPLPLILTKIVKKYPEKTFGILVRGCDERHIIELIKNKKLEAEKVVLVGFSCPEDLAKKCRCEKPYPDNLVFGEKTDSFYKRDDIEKIEEIPMEKDRFSFWRKEFERCIKCYGCRNVCPQCFCDTCALEDGGLISSGTLPPSIPSFHLVRAFHMAGRCVDCGLCEEACPAHIPLRTLYRKVRESVKDLFGYEPGRSVEEMEPFGYLGDGMFEIPERIR